MPALPGYSYRSATIGSTFIARRAGTKQAPRATPVSSAEIITNVAGSRDRIRHHSIDPNRRQNQCNRCEDAKQQRIEARPRD